jgi:hypothetical protein
MGGQHRLEPYGMIILITLLFFVPMFGAQMGIDLNIISRLIGAPTEGQKRATCLKGSPERWQGPV